MKRIFISVLCLFAALAAGAQTMYDAINFSENNYSGSARTIGLGNAVTALGSDLGTIGINPAGSAVAGYSQFTFSPSIVYSSTDVVFTDVHYNDNDNNELISTINNSTSSRNRMALPNIAGTFVLNTGRNHGLKSMTFGLVSNTTNNWLDKFDATGGGNQTSMFGSIASYAQAMGYDPSILASSEGYDRYQWKSVSAYQSGLIGDFGDKQYAAATEQILKDKDGNPYCITSGYLNRDYSRKVSGTKYDIVFNYAMNFSDKLFLGVNLGFPCGHYAFSENLTETPAADDLSDFSFTYETGEEVSFQQGTNTYAYTADLSGIYAKVGVIWLPVAGLRVGAAVQTPTLLEVTEHFQTSMYSLFNNSENRATSPQGDYSYYIYAPWRYNVGAAYTIGRIGLVSADYERVNYRNMRYDDIDDGYYTDSFADVNSEIKTYAGASNMLRVGIEARPISKLALRLGYALTTKDTDFVDTKIQSFSFGAGYTSDSSFFCDFAVRGTQYPVYYNYPYDYYTTQEDSNESVVVIDDRFTVPEIKTTRSLFEFVATFGWRF